LKGLSEGTLISSRLIGRRPWNQLPKVGDSQLASTQYELTS
jgi:hypothetical protein